MLPQRGQFEWATHHRGRSARARVHRRGECPTNQSAIACCDAMFDDALDQWLPRLSGRLDLVHIDGQHERGSTLHYFERLKPRLHSGALVIFDDIHWSDDMRQVWREIATARGVSHSINVGRYGLCVWSGTAEPPRVHDFSRYARNWQIENRPMPSLC